MSRFENGKINLETVSFRPLLFYFTREQRSGEVTGGRNEVKEVSLRWEMGKIILLGRGEEKFSGEEKLIHFFILFNKLKWHLHMQALFKALHKYGLI